VSLARLPVPQSLPWRRPRHEVLLLVLVAAATLFVVTETDTQDASRVCLAKALVAGRLYADACLRGQDDRSLYGGHFYSNKAPGMSLLEIAPVEAVGLPAAPSRWNSSGDLRLWFVRLVASGLPFLLAVFLVGRVSEGLAPGFGGAAMVTFALGTQMAPFAAAGFSHPLTAALGFLAFVLASRKRPVLAGLAAGFAVTTEYDAAATFVLLLLYAALRGWRPPLLYLAGAVPGLAVLGAYDWAAFGAPWHDANRYTYQTVSAQINSGVLGIHLPTLHDTGIVFLGDRGLLVASPVVVAAAAGLVLVWRQGLRAEALLCAAVVAAFTIANSGYFAPLGGASPGPRYLVPMLPFLALGLGPAFARWRVVTSVLAAVSIAATAVLTLSWIGFNHYRQTVWGEALRVLRDGGGARVLTFLPGFVPTWNTNKLIGAAIVLTLTAAAFVVGVLGAGRYDRPVPE
jgi:hypothetical protein